jgi:hypothetical protein
MHQRTGEGSGAGQKQKTNLETDEFTCNPPFSKKELAGVLSHPSFGGNDGLKKNENLEFFKKVLNSGTLARKLFQII